MKQKLFFLSLLVTTLPLFASDIEVFRTHCMGCHGKSTPAIHPVDKARIQWHRFFKRNVHRPPLTLDTKQTVQVLDFLLDHAADSDQPMVPGL